MKLLWWDSQWVESRTQIRRECGYTKDTWLCFGGAPDIPYTHIHNTQTFRWCPKRTIAAVLSHSHHSSVFLAALDTLRFVRFVIITNPQKRPPIYTKNIFEYTHTLNEFPTSINGTLHHHHHTSTYIYSSWFEISHGGIFWCKFFFMLFQFWWFCCGGRWWWLLLFRSIVVCIWKNGHL